MPPSPNGLNEDISELMQKEITIDESDSISEQNDSKVESNNKKEADGEADYKENEQPPSKKVKQFDTSWESSDISFLAETPVSSSFSFTYSIY